MMSSLIPGVLDEVSVTTLGVASRELLQGDDCVQLARRLPWKVHSLTGKGTHDRIST